MFKNSTKLKPWPCLGQKIPKIHTLLRTKPSILWPCLGQTRTKLYTLIWEVA